MKLYLTDGQIPELAPLTKAQRRIVRRGSIRMLEQERPFARWACAVPSGIGGGAGALAGILLTRALGADFFFIFMIICAGIGGGAGGFIAGSLLVERLRPYFRRFIAEHPDEFA